MDIFLILHVSNNEKQKQKIENQEKKIAHSTYTRNIPWTIKSLFYVIIYANWL